MTEITADLAELLSWSVGVAFGRFDLRLATGERELPAEPDPFDRLPARSPVRVILLAAHRPDHRSRRFSSATCARPPSRRWG
jgi:hypothetical protein